MAATGRFSDQTSTEAHDFKLLALSAAWQALVLQRNVSTIPKKRDISIPADVLQTPAYSSGGTSLELRA